MCGRPSHAAVGADAGVAIRHPSDRSDDILERPDGVGLRGSVPKGLGNFGLGGDRTAQNGPLICRVFLFLNIRGLSGGQGLTGFA